MKKNDYINSNGIIQDLDRLQQSAEWDNLRFVNQKGTIMAPGDIDLAFDWRKKLNIMGDFKLGAKALEPGQHYTYTNMIDLLQKGGEIDYPDYGAYFLIISHDTPREQRTYDASTCEVKRVYYKGKWDTIKSPLTLKEAFKRIILKHGLEDEIREHVEVPIDDIWEACFGSKLGDTK